MNSRQLEALLGKMKLPERADVPPSPESIELLKEFGLYDESAAGSEAAEADREVGK